MGNNSYSHKWVGAGLLSAVAASMCCITPVLAFLAGSSGMAATFSWMEPFRPYLMGITILIIGFAWYQKLRPRPTEEINCDCEDDGKMPFLQSKSFLAAMTVFAAFMLAFPYYSSTFYPQTEKTAIPFSEEHLTQTLVLNITGMTCAGCEAHVEQAVKEVAGIQHASASYEEGKAQIVFDPSQTNSKQIIEAVNTTGYKITQSNIPSLERE